MRYLIVGLGSMGKRRIRNLIANGESEIFGLDSREDRRKDAELKYGIRTFDSLSKVDNLNNIDAIIISVPPDKHMEYAKFALKNSKHCFIEASVVDEGINELIGESKLNNNIKICPSCTLRFHPSIKLIKNLVQSGAIGKVSNFSYHSGQYLPDWHPWESIEEFYVSKRETGGCREIVPFELTWLNWVFGSIKKVYGYFEKTIDLGVDIDDVYTFLLKFKNGTLGSVIVDVVSRSAIRQLAINGDKGQILWNWNDNMVRFYDANQKRWIDYHEPHGHSEKGYNANIIEEMYIEEIKSFIDCIKGERDFPNTLEDDYEILQVLYTIEKSENNGRDFNEGYSYQK